MADSTAKGCGKALIVAAIVFVGTFSLFWLIVASIGGAVK